MPLSSVTEAAILERAIAAKPGVLTTSAARSLLEFRLSPRDSARVRSLLRKNNAGTISSAERMTLDNYLRVGQFLDLLHARARLSLAKRPKAK